MKAALRGSALAHARRPRESSSFGFEGEGGTETGEIRQADHELPGRRERPEIPFFLPPPTGSLVSAIGSDCPTSEAALRDRLQNPSRGPSGRSSPGRPAANRPLVAFLSRRAGVEFSRLPPQNTSVQPVRAAAKVAWGVGRPVP
jgi:hypothetical protein